VRITLTAKGLAWDAIRIDLFKSEQYDPKYLKLNPKGVVPTLVHDGTPVIESTLICEYLDETFPDPPLMPKEAAARTRMRLWSKLVDEGRYIATNGSNRAVILRCEPRSGEPRRMHGPDVAELGPFHPSRAAFGGHLRMTDCASCARLGVAPTATMHTDHLRSTLPSSPCPNP
jgi:glutathione S-transferase